MDACRLMVARVPKERVVRALGWLNVVNTLSHDCALVIQVQLAKLITLLLQKPFRVFAPPIIVSPLRRGSASVPVLLALLNELMRVLLTILIVCEVATTGMGAKLQTLAHPVLVQNKSPTWNRAIKKDKLPLVPFSLVAIIALK